VLTLALGIGATTAIFTVVNAVLLRPLPYPHPEELVYVQQVFGNFGILPYAWNREYVAWRNQSRTLSQVSAYMYSWFNLTGSGEPERVTSGVATSSFFSLLGVRPVVGRLFLPEEDRPGGPPVVILSDALRKRRYGGDPSVVGRGVTLDDKTYTVVGVLPATFIIPDRIKMNYALWVPLAESETGRGGFRTVRVIGRLKPGVTVATARAELDTIMQSTLPKGLKLKKSVVLSPWQEQITERARLSLLLFLGAVGFLLLIACVNVANVSPDYFRTMKIPLKQGRYFGVGDRDGSLSVAIVNESFTRRYFPDEICLGRKLHSWVHKDDWLTIVGIVGDVRDWAEREPDPEIYLPYLQAGEPYMTLLVHTSGNPRLWEGAVRRQVASVDKDQPIHDLASLDELRAGSFTSRRVNLLLLGGFAGLGLILASVGIYGVVAYSVSRCTHEIGVRMALGAERGDVLRGVVGQGIRSVLIGTGIGVAGSLAVTRLLRTMLFGVKPTDPVTFVAVSLVLLVVAWLACYIPARRATKVDPMVALRYE
jgi:hypothetical protein